MLCWIWKTEGGYFLLIEGVNSSCKDIIRFTSKSSRCFGNGQAADSLPLVQPPFFFERQRLGFASCYFRKRS